MSVRSPTHVLRTRTASSPGLGPCWRRVAVVVWRSKDVPRVQTHGDNYNEWVPRAERPSGARAFWLQLEAERRQTAARNNYVSSHGLPLSHLTTAGILEAHEARAPRAAALVPRNMICWTRTTAWASLQERGTTPVKGGSRYWRWIPVTLINGATEGKIVPRRMHI